MEFQTAAEEALYHTLQNVLRNHVTLHHISHYHTLAACVPVLAYVLYVMSDGPEDIPSFAAESVRELQDRFHTRVQHGEPPLPIFTDYETNTDQDPHGHGLGTALATLLATSGVEENMSVSATWRVMLSLLADVMATPVCEGERSLEAVEASIQVLRADLPAVVRMWAEEGQSQ